MDAGTLESITSMVSISSRVCQIGRRENPKSQIKPRMPIFDGRNTSTFEAHEFVCTAQTKPQNMIWRHIEHHIHSTCNFRAADFKTIPELVSNNLLSKLKHAYIRFKTHVIIRIINSNIGNSKSCRFLLRRTIKHGSKKEEKFI